MPCSFPTQVVVIVERLCYTMHILYPLRYCGSDLERLLFDSNGRVPLDRDPKRAYAELHPTAAPIGINRASPEELRLVPGGPRSIQKIISARPTHRLLHTSHLRSLGILAERAAPHILLTVSDRNGGARCASETALSGQPEPAAGPPHGRSGGTSCNPRSSNRYAHPF